jgi:hypothetical protein
MARQDWFGVFNATRPLEQGVVVFGLKYLDIQSISAAAIEGEDTVERVKSDVIILTQSCDLAAEKTQHIHVCPIMPLREMFGQLGYDTWGKKKSFFEELKKQRRVEKYLTNTNNIKSFGTKYYNDYIVVNFDLAVIVSNEYLREIVGKKKNYLILKSPYREAMAQAYGRYFMRVGNPTDIVAINSDDYPSN